MKKNLTRFISQKLRLASRKEEIKMFLHIFGGRGLIQCTDEIEFVEKSTEFLAHYYERLGSHYNWMVKFLSRIHKNVLNPNWVTHTIPG